MAALALALGGCATVPNPTRSDPWEGFNRPVHEFNEGVDRIFLRPVATFYREKVPPLVRTGVSNFFGNLNDVWSGANSLLQFRLQDAADSIARVNINTVVGFGGIVDVASNFNIERHREDFGQTLGRWGVPTGPYLVIPLLGPATLRDAAALPVDLTLHPVSYLDSFALGQALFVLGIVDRRSNLLRVGMVLDEAALDKYSFIRDAHLQRRRAQVFDREADDDRQTPPALPDESLDPATVQPAAAQPAAPVAR
ncbi:VacJ family lipoprotein [Ramlibacter sp. PS3R-8]|uniref:MlaA family lipoprotein n=1 Tax=Ramlibacter sp. PS3R-8 TaxID=3133437 RepID=UPI00309D283C